MKLSDLKQGKYVVAVSGGVDSMVLLDLLSKKEELDLIVAHFNHGMRSDSHEDEKLVGEVAAKLNKSFEVGYGKLGAAASEAVAREARYRFLEAVKLKHGAKGIITAHHQDDLIETAMINILRGSGPLGLISLRSRQTIKRPLLNLSKQQMLNYAKKNNLVWREDSTNTDERFLRNYIRKNITPKLSKEQKKELLKNIDKVAKNVKDKHRLIATLSQNVFKQTHIDRSRFSLLPSDVANELLADWLRLHGLRDFDRPLINRLNTVVKTGAANSRHDLAGGLKLTLTKTTAKLETNI